MLQTYDAEFVRDLPCQPPRDEDALVLAAVMRDGRRIPMRYVLFSRYKEQRRVNRVPDSLSDRVFLSDGCERIITGSKGEITHFEIGVTDMPGKSSQGTRMEFSPDAFGKQGTTTAESSK